MTLPYDYARCNGEDVPLCRNCRRREPGREEYQCHIEPRLTERGCENYIGRLNDAAAHGK